MKKNKGVTLASLTIYVIVLVIILIALTFISGNFTSQISEVNARGKVSNEYIKLCSFLVTDVKSAHKVVEYADDYIRFDNDVKYSIKYLTTLSNKEHETRQYEIYRNDVLISENILDAVFDYDVEENNLLLNIKYIYGDILVEKGQTFRVGRGY